MSLPDEFKRFPKHWDVLPFTDVVSDATSGNLKIQKGDFLDEGEIPVVDQGQALFGGYTDNSDAVCKAALPTIIFGDHTRLFKFIEQPFALGADGAKVLEPVEKLDKKFLFHYLTQLRITSAGYSRHYKFLKETYVPVPPLPEQKRIAAILDKADAIRRKRQQAIQLADEYLRSVFLEMFGDPNANTKGIGVKPMTEFFDITTGKLNSNAATADGKYPFFTCAKEIFAIDEFAFDQEALLLAGNNAQAEYDVKYYKGKFNAYQRTYVLTLKDVNNSYPFYKYALEYQLQNLKRVSKGTSTKYITMEIMERTMLPAPGFDLQNRFLKFYEKYRKIIGSNINSLESMNNNFHSLSQKAFSGQL